MRTPICRLDWTYELLKSVHKFSFIKEFSSKLQIERQNDNIGETNLQISYGRLQSSWRLPNTNLFDVQIDFT